MNRKIRKILDWIELPKTIFNFIKMNKFDRECSKKQMHNWSCEWRKNTLSFKIAKWFLNFL